MTTTPSFTVIASCKYHGKSVPMDINTAKYRMFIDLQNMLQKHGNPVMWHKIQSGVGHSIQLSGATRLQLIASLPHVSVVNTEHGSVITYKQ